MIRPHTLAARRAALAIALSLGAWSSASAQRIGIKTNALYWAAATPNLGVEFRLNRHLTLDVEGAFNKFSIKSHSSRAVAFMPEMRYWLSARPQAGHFIGVMALAADYKVNLNGKWHNGDIAGAGATYGYSFVLSRRWSFEATAGIGLARIREKKYKEGEAAPKTANNSKWTPAPLKLGATFTYLIK